MCLDTGQGENQRWGAEGPQGVPWGHTQDRYPGLAAFSATLLALGRGPEGKITCSDGRRLRLVPRGAALIPQPHQRDQRRGPERFSFRSAVVAIFKKGKCPQPGGVSGPALVCLGVLDRLPQRPCLLRVGRNSAWVPPVGGVSTADRNPAWFLISCERPRTFLPEDHCLPVRLPCPQISALKSCSFLLTPCLCGLSTDLAP